MLLLIIDKNTIKGYYEKDFLLTSLNRLFSPTE